MDLLPKTLPSFITLHTGYQGHLVDKGVRKQIIASILRRILVGVQGASKDEYSNMHPLTQHRRRAKRPAIGGNYLFPCP